MNEKKRTINYIKEKRKVPERLKKQMKEFMKIKRTILKTLESEPKTIPQIAEKTNLPQHIITYHLMTLRKYGEIETDKMDDMDEYYYYKKKENKNDKNKS